MSFLSRWFFDPLHAAPQAQRASDASAASKATSSVKSSNPERARSGPFLISRTRSVDYDVMAAPEFIDKLAAQELGRIDPDGVSAGQARHQVVTDRNGRQFTAVYRVVPAVVDGAQARDAHGRPILALVGLVFEGAIPRGDISMSKELLELAKADTDRVFAERWSQNTDAFQSHASLQGRPFVQARGSALSLVPGG